MLPIPTEEISVSYTHLDVYKRQMYYFTWKSRIKGLGACHALELPFVFGNMEEEESFTGLDVPDNLPSMMQEAWASFAKAGKPSAKGAPQWARCV